MRTINLINKYLTPHFLSQIGFISGFTIYVIDYTKEIENSSNKNNNQLSVATKNIMFRTIHFLKKICGTLLSQPIEIVFMGSMHGVAVGFASMFMGEIFPFALKPIIPIFFGISIVHVSSFLWKTKI